jgi:hypothetical protein
MPTENSTVDAAARERIELYWLAHPATPSAIWRPRLVRRRGRWVALGVGAASRVTGLGTTVEAALRAFDRRYVFISRTNRSSNEMIVPPQRDTVDSISRAMKSSRKARATGAKSVSKKRKRPEKDSITQKSRTAESETDKAARAHRLVLAALRAWETQQCGSA